MMLRLRCWVSSRAALVIPPQDSGGITHWLEGHFRYLLIQ
jgi:hypothetical protein